MKRVFELASLPFRIIGTIGVLILIAVVFGIAYATATPQEREAFLNS